MFGGTRPSPALGFVARRFAQGLSFDVVPQKSLGGFDQAGGTAILPTRFVEAAVHTVGDDVGDAAAVGAYHRAAGGHGFK